MLLVLFAGAVAIFATGCWMLAAQLAPVAISAAENVGEGAVSLAAGVAETVTMENHKDEDLAKGRGAYARKLWRRTGTAASSFAAEAPGVIELRKERRRRA